MMIPIPDLKIRRVLAGGYMLFILALSLKPVFHDYPPVWTREMLHNLTHVPAYAIMALLVSVCWGHSGLLGENTLAGTFMICCAYGAGIEFLQGFVPGRSPSLLDVGLNTAGIIMALWVATRYKWYAFFTENHQKNI